MEKSHPIRTCIATGKKDEKRNMIRLVRKASGEVVVDGKGKERGRGANLVMDIEAFDLAIKKGAIERALKLEKKLITSDYERLRVDFLDVLKQKQLRGNKKNVDFKISKEEFDKIKASEKMALSSNG